MLSIKEASIIVCISSELTVESEDNRYFWFLGSRINNSRQYIEKKKVNPKEEDI